MKNAFLNLFTLLVVLAMFGVGCKFSTDPEPSAANSNATNTQKQSNTANQSDSAAKPVDSDKTTANDSEPIPSRRIMEAFKKDKDAAKQYRGKTLTVRGKITNINNAFGAIIINLRDSEDEMGLGAYLNDVADKERLKVGDEVIVRGVLRDDGNEIMDKTEIIKIN